MARRAVAQARRERDGNTAPECRRSSVVNHGDKMSNIIITLSNTIFFRLLAHAPEELQREAKGDAGRAIPAFCFTEEDIRERFRQEEQWDEMSEDEQREAIQSLIDAVELCYLNDNFAGLARLSFLSGLTALSFHSSNSNP
jgi:hypothetical protein